MAKKKKSGRRAQPSAPAKGPARDALNDHWLVWPQTIRLLWILFSMILAGVVVADLFVTHHPHFGIDGSFGFGAWFGLVSCVVLVVGSLLLGGFLKRRDSYYDN